MSDRPTCSRCSKPIATDVSKCGDSQCLNTYHPRCSYLFTKTASAPECCKKAFPFGRNSKSIASNRTVRKNQTASKSRSERARLFDSDRDQNMPLSHSPDRSQHQVPISGRPPSRQSGANNVTHLPLAHPQSQQYVQNPFLHQPAAGLQNFRPISYPNTPHSSHPSAGMGRPSLAMTIPTPDLPHDSQIVHPDTWANLSPAEQQSAMYSCMYSCLMSNQRVQSQISAINERVATAEGNASTALQVASSNKNTISYVQDEVVQLRSEVKGLREASATGMNNSSLNFTWSSSLLISGIPFAAGKNYEEIAHLIFKAIGAQRYISDITSATRKERQHKPSFASAAPPTENLDNMEESVAPQNNAGATNSGIPDTAAADNPAEVSNGAI